MEGKWEAASPATTGGFTATEYSLAKAIQGALGTPVGLLHASWGGTQIEAWTSVEGLSRDVALKNSALKYQEYEQRFPDLLRTYQADWSGWATRLGLYDLEGSAPGSDAIWKALMLPGDAPTALPAVGAVWLQKSFD